MVKGRRGLARGTHVQHLVCSTRGVHNLLLAGVAAMGGLSFPVWAGSLAMHAHLNRNPFTAPAVSDGLQW